MDMGLDVIWIRHMILIFDTLIASLHIYVQCMQCFSYYNLWTRLWTVSLIDLEKALLNGLIHVICPRWFGAIHPTLQFESTSPKYECSLVGKA